MNRHTTTKGQNPKHCLVARLTKAQIRSKILLKLKLQKEENREKKSRLIKNRLFRTLVFRKAKSVMFYLSFNGEVETGEMIKQAQKLGKTVAVPRCRPNGQLIPCLFREHMKLEKGLYGMNEPAVERRFDLRNIDLVIVPGLAFDTHGRRLGRGKGCYDRFLKKIPKAAVSIGLAFDFQILPDIPTTQTDVDVNRVLFA